MPKHSIEYVRDFVLKNSNAKLISTTYNNSKEKLEFECSCGEKFETSFETFRADNKRKCNYCTGFRKKEKICPSCNEKFLPHRKEQVCCCRKCSNDLKHPKYTVKCSFCNKGIERRKSEIENRINHYCSSECRYEHQKETLRGNNNPNWRNKTSIGWCDCCGKEIAITQYTKSKNKYCSQKCKSEHQKEILQGNKNPNWKIEKSDEIRIKERQTTGYKQWRMEVFKKHNFNCAKCGTNSKGDNKLVAHHILNYYNHPHLRTDVDNGICFCSECHWEFHRIYGTLNNNEQQINEFLTKENVT